MVGEKLNLQLLFSVMHLKLHVTAAAAAGVA